MYILVDHVDPVQSVCGCIPNWTLSVSEGEICELKCVKVFIVSR